MAKNVIFKSNKAAVMKKYTRALAAALDALGLRFTQLSVEEMDALIYHAPLPPSAGPKYKRTGHLRSGQDYKLDLGDNCVIVFNSVEYAVHVHFEGITRNWGGRPWMTNTINGRQKELQEAVVTVFQHMMK